MFILFIKIINLRLNVKSSPQNIRNYLLNEPSHLISPMFAKLAIKFQGDADLKLQENASTIHVIKSIDDRHMAHIKAWKKFLWTFVLGTRKQGTSIMKPVKPAFLRTLDDNPNISTDKTSHILHTQN